MLQFVLILHYIISYHDTVSYHIYHTIYYHFTHLYYSHKGIVLGFLPFKSLKTPDIDSRWKLPFCLISVIRKMSLWHIPKYSDVCVLESTNVLHAVSHANASRPGPLQFSISSLACYATFCYLKLEHLQMTLLWCRWSSGFFFLVSRNLTKKYSPKRGSKEEQECR